DGRRVGARSSGWPSPESNRARARTRWPYPAGRRGSPLIESVAVGMLREGRREIVARVHHDVHHVPGLAAESPACRLARRCGGRLAIAALHLTLRPAAHVEVLMPARDAERNAGVEILLGGALGGYEHG